jgi:flagellar hook-basal body complex protein FliE
MTNIIGHLGAHAPLQSAAGKLTPAAGKTDDGGFQQLLKATLQETAGMQNQAQQSIQDRLAGGELTNAQVFTDLRKADLAMRMMLQIRNKLLESFNEIKQMQF